MFVAGYGHFVRTARALQWQEESLDLRADQAAWPGLADERRKALRTLLAGFCLGEARVADELRPFATAAPDREAAACFRLQAGDEARHARFFDRYVSEVLAVGGATPDERRAELRAEARPDFLDLFEERLSAAAGRLAEDASTLEAAVALYHLVLEGLVFTAGQLALLELLKDDSLPGLRRGLELVLRDERWHIGFGASLLSAAGGGVEADALDAAQDAVGVWGDAVPRHLRERVLHLHRRRLRAAGLSSANREAAATAAR